MRAPTLASLARFARLGGLGRLAGLAAAALAAESACVGTTGGETVTFTAAAAGPPDAVAGQPLAFTSPYGDAVWNVVLTKATLHVGALYLDQSLPVSGSQGTSCILPGTYVAQVLPSAVREGNAVTVGLDVDLLSPTPQSFAGSGQGTTIPPALAGQVWLTTGDVNSPDTTPILTIAGTAERDGTTMPFTGTITIGTNHEETGTEIAGGDPICKEHIVLIPTSVVVGTTGGLLVRIDPRLLFVNVDFSQLTKFSDTFGFTDDPGSPDYTQPSLNLYQNLHSSSAYSFSWSPSL
jgi:hypothetical protein